MVFNFRIKHEGKVLAKAKGERIKDFDPLIKDLKKKFGEK